MKVNIIGTIKERFPHLEITVNDSKSSIIPHCKLDNMVCRDPEKKGDDLAILPTQGEEVGTYHVAHFFSSRAESCKMCPRNKEQL